MNGANHVCECKKCVYKETVWYDDEDYGYEATCKNSECINFGKEIYDEDSIE